MEKKKLPEIIITGTIQELVEIEPLLVMAGYDQNDKIHDSINNNRVIAGNAVGIRCYEDGVYVYRTNVIIDVDDERNLRAREIHKILHYIETGEIKEYIEDKINVDWYNKSLEFAIKNFSNKKKKLKGIGQIPYYFDLTNHIPYDAVESALMVENEIKKGLKRGTIKEKPIHTGQTKVVGKRIGDKPYTLKDLMSQESIVKASVNNKKTTKDLKNGFRNSDDSLTATTPIKPKYHVRDWKAVEKAFKEWADPDKRNCICYYSPTSQLEILLFFKKHFK